MFVVELFEFDVSVSSDFMSEEGFVFDVGFVR